MPLSLSSPVFAAAIIHPNGIERFANNPGMRTLCAMWDRLENLGWKLDLTTASTEESDSVKYDLRWRTASFKIKPFQNPSNPSSDLLSPPIYLAKILKFFAQQEEIEYQAAIQLAEKDEFKVKFSDGDDFERLMHADNIMRNRGWRQLIEDARTPISESQYRFEAPYYLLHPTDYLVRETISRLDMDLAAAIVSTSLEREFFGHAMTFPDAPETIDQAFLDTHIIPSEGGVHNLVNALAYEITELHKVISQFPPQNRPLVFWHHRTNPSEFYWHTASMWEFNEAGDNEDAILISPFLTPAGGRALREIQYHMLGLDYCWGLADKREINSAWGRNLVLAPSVVDQLLGIFPKPNFFRTLAQNPSNYWEMGMFAVLGEDHPHAFLQPTFKDVHILERRKRIMERFRIMKRTMNSAKEMLKVSYWKEYPHRIIMRRDDDHRQRMARLSARDAEVNKTLFPDWASGVLIEKAFIEEALRSLPPSETAPSRASPALRTKRRGNTAHPSSPTCNMSDEAPLTSQSIGLSPPADEIGRIEWASRQLSSENIILAKEGELAEWLASRKVKTVLDDEKKSDRPVPNPGRGNFIDPSVA